MSVVILLLIYSGPVLYPHQQSYHNDRKLGAVRVYTDDERKLACLQYLSMSLHKRSKSMLRVATISASAERY